MVSFPEGLQSRSRGRRLTSRRKHKCCQRPSEPMWCPSSFVCVPDHCRPEQSGTRWRGSHSAEPTRKVATAVVLRQRVSGQHAHKKVGDTDRGINRDGRQNGAGNRVVVVHDICCVQQCTKRAPRVLQGRSWFLRRRVSDSLTIIICMCSVSRLPYADEPNACGFLFLRATSSCSTSRILDVRE